MPAVWQLKSAIKVFSGYISLSYCHKWGRTSLLTAKSQDVQQTKVHWFVNDFYVSYHVTEESSKSSPAIASTDPALTNLREMLPLVTDSWVLPKCRARTKSDSAFLINRLRKDGAKWGEWGPLLVVLTEPPHETAVQNIQPSEVGYFILLYFHVYIVILQ